MDFTVNQATGNLILVHLKDCDAGFIPPLSSKVDLWEYSQKMEKYSTTFEAWSGEILTGLVAAYFNDPAKKKGFITNVSVLPAFKGKGIASQLMEKAIQFAKDGGFESVELEVKPHNSVAIHLYSRFGFVRGEENENVLKMIYLVNENNN